MPGDSLPPGTASSKTNISKKISINDVELKADIPVSQITVSKSFNKITYAKIVILDGSVEKRDFLISNSDNFKPGNKIKVELGYNGKTKTVFEGIIVKHGIKVRQQGRTQLLIEAKDKAIKITGARKSAYYTNKSDSDVIKSLAKGLDSAGVTDTKTLHKQLVQFESTDWDFIITRAEANGMLVFTDDGKLIIKKPAFDGKPVLEAIYGQNIWEFEADMDARRQISSVSGVAWDYTKQTQDKATPQEVSVPDQSTAELANVLGTNITLTHTGYLTQDQLQPWVDAYDIRNKLSKAIGRVRISGDAAVKPGDMIKLTGVGKRFNGNVFVSGVLHHYEGSWQTDIQFGWKEDWFYNKEKIMEKPAAGLLPGINGLQIGKVLGTENTKDDQYRVKVYIATITNKQDGIWARVASLDAGKDHGVYFRPQVDDEVILGFLNDDPREPVILGYLHSSGKNNSPLPEKNGELQYGIVTKNGIKLVLDDTKKKMTLNVKSDRGEKTITINDASGAMELKDENNNSIKMDASGITISSGKVITIKGATVKIN